jgi:YgiT-type zinc finger domain-containing protein
MTASSACEICGGAVEPTTGGGRTFEYRRGLALAVPDDFSILTCAACGETYLSLEEHRALAEAQKPAFLEWQKGHVSRVLRAIRDANKVSLRDIERACGVTGTYLSHVLAGRNEAGQVLINHLEALALYPDEFRRELDRGPWDVAYQRSLRERSAMFFAPTNPTAQSYEWIESASGSGNHATISTTGDVVTTVVVAPGLVTVLGKPPQYSSDKSNEAVSVGNDNGVAA